MKRLKLSDLLAVSAVAMSLVTGQALAADLAPEKTDLPIYVSVFGGVNWSKLDGNFSSTSSSYAGGIKAKNKSGYLFGGAIGTRLTDNLRAELELSHTNAKVKSLVLTNSYGYTLSGTGSGAKISSSYLLGNLWFDLPVGDMVRPYVGGGIGAGSVKATSFDRDTALAMQLGAGVNVDVTENVAVDFGYRLKHITGLNSSDGAGLEIKDADLTSHNLQVGLTVKF